MPNLRQGYLPIILSDCWLRLPTGLEAFLAAGPNTDLMRMRYLYGVFPLSTVSASDAYKHLSLLGLNLFRLRSTDLLLEVNLDMIREVLRWVPDSDCTRHGNDTKRD